MGPVLACVDGSDVTASVIGVARKLADALGLELVLLHVAPRTEAPGVSAAPGGQQRLHEEELRDAEALLDRIASEAGLDSNVRRRAQTGAAADRIVEVCADEGADLVVLGSHGRGGLKRALLGSVSTNVASRAPCPCVVVSPHAAEHGFLA
jgi:nucleotide-binding universal stress UspA family protein